MLKKIIAVIFMLGVLGCLLSIFAENVFFYIFCFAIFALAVLFALLILAGNLISGALPENLKKQYRKKKDRVNAIVFIAILFFLFSQVLFSEIIMPGAGRFLSPMANATVIAFMVFLAWRSTRPNKIKSIVPGSVIFVLCIALLSFVNSMTLKSSKIKAVDPIENLKSLGYVDWVPAGKNIDKTGVVRYDPELAFDGLNLFTSRPTCDAQLIDMQGNIVHKWSAKENSGQGWQHVEICENGDLLVIVKDYLLVCLDWNSNVKWKKNIRAHHDVSFHQDKIYLLAREDKLFFWHGIPVPILSDYIVIMSRNAEIKKTIHITDLLKDRFTLRTFARIYLNMLKPVQLWKILQNKSKFNYTCINATYFDITHTNSIVIIDRDIEGFCKKGDWLISMRELDLIGVVDVQKEAFAWNWGPGELDRQHHPLLLNNGNVLIFDNGTKRGFSRIIELNPLTRKIVWEYKSKPPEDFYSGTRGGNQRLPNGNTLIVNSNSGQVFEVTKENRVVWEFYNPEIAWESKKRASIYRMMRISYPQAYERAGIKKQ